MIVILILCLFIAQPRILEHKNDWVMENMALKATISKGNGAIHELAADRQQIINGAVTIWFNRHRTDNGSLKNISPSGQNPKLSFDIIYGDRAIKTVYYLDSLALHLSYQVNLEGNATVKIVELKIPINKTFKSLSYPGGKDPSYTGNEKTLVYYCRDIALPMITLHDPTTAYGVTVIVPPITPESKLAFTLDHDTVIISFEDIKFIEKKLRSFDLLIVPEHGDWRMGLYVLSTLYPEYFHPSIKKIPEGSYYLGSSFEDESIISGLSEKNIAWVELHGHFPFYGLYVPPQKNWGIITDSDLTSLTAWETEAGKNRNSYLRMNQQIELWHKNEIQTYLYFQPFEAWHQYAEKYYLSDIAKDRTGQNLPAWKYCTLMNPDPGSPWGKHIIEQAQRILEKYPTIDGVFWDRMDYYFNDFAHDDGLTTIDGKPAYMLGFALERMNDTIFKLFHDQGKAIWGNGPTSLEVCKNLDGIMAEGSLANLYKIQYLGLVRPIVYLPYDKTPDETEEKLKNCFLCGAFPAVTYGDSACQKLEEKYRPLFDILKGRTWILSPRPVSVPDKYRSNIFRTREGNYAVVILSPGKSQAYNAFEYNIPVAIEVPDGQYITKAYIMSPDWPGIQDIKFRKNGSRLDLQIPYHLVSSMIVLTKGQSYATTTGSPIPALNEISITPPRDTFIQPWENAIIPVEITNNTSLKQSLKIKVEAIDMIDQFHFYQELTMKPLETKIIEVKIKSIGSGFFRINTYNDRLSLLRKFKIRTGLIPGSNDLFNDDFSRPMVKWTIDQGTWHVNHNVAEGSGPDHFAYHINNHWENYQYQATTRIKGSDDPEVNWYKSYIFFRVQDNRNFYRFGLHGDAGAVDLFKCVNGLWTQIGTANFTTEPNIWYTLMIAVQGNKIIGFVNGKRVIVAVDPTFLKGGVGLGVMEDAMRVEYRDIIVKKLD